MRPLRNVPSRPIRVATMLAHAALASCTELERTAGDSQLPLVGRARISAVYDIEARPPYAYVLERGVLHVLDISDPSAPRTINTLEFERPRVRAALRFPFLYLTGFGQPLAVVDVSDPASLRWVAEFPDLTGTLNDVFEIDGDRAYLVRRQEGNDDAGRLILDVLDLASDPARPRRLAALDLGFRTVGEYGGITARDGVVFLIISRPIGAEERSAVIEIDARDGAAPRVARQALMPLNERYQDIETRDDLLYLLQGGPREQESGLAIFRWPPDTEPALVGRVLQRELWMPIDLVVQGDAVHVTFKGGATLGTFDVGNPRSPRIAATYAETAGWASGLGLSLADGRLYVTGDNGPSTIFDIGSPLTPRLIGKWSHIGGWASGVAIDSPLAVVTSYSDLLLVDLTDPTSPRFAGRHAGVPSYDPALWQDGLAIDSRGSRVVVAYETLPSEVLDVRDPARPTVLATFRPGGPIHKVALGPDHAYLALRDTSAGIVEVVELGSPTRPRSVATLAFERPVVGLATTGSRLVVVDDFGVLHVANVTDPTTPEAAGRVAASAAPAGREARVATAVDGSLAFVVFPRASEPGDTVVTLALVDLARADGPALVSTLDVGPYGGWLVDVVVCGTRPLVAVALGQEIKLVDVGQPGAPRVVARGLVPPLSWVEALAADERHVYAAAGEDGLLVYALADFNRGRTSKPFAH